MREARIILPCPEGSENVHALLARRLANRFGGYTKTLGVGGWVNPDDGALVTEPVAIYDVAAEGTDFDAIDLQVNLEAAGRQLEQHSVYVRQFDGVVRIIKL